MKKILAILCTLALLFSCVFTGVVVSAEELTVLNASDYNYNNESIVESPRYHNTLVDGQKFVNVSFRSQVKLTDSTGYLRFCAPSWAGLDLSFNTSSVKFYDGTGFGSGLETSTYTFGTGILNRYVDMVVDITEVAEGLNYKITFDGVLAFDKVVLEENTTNVRTICGLLGKNLVLADLGTETELHVLKPSNYGLDKASMVESPTYNAVYVDGQKFVDVSFRALVRVTDIASGAYFRFCHPSWAGLDLTFTSETSVAFHDGAGLGSGLEVSSYNFESSILNKDIEMVANIREVPEGINYKIYFDGNLAFDKVIPNETATKVRELCALLGKNITLADGDIKDPETQEPEVPEVPEEPVEPEDPKDLGAIAPSDYGADGLTFPESYAWGATNAPIALKNAVFNAMVVPKGDNHYIQFGGQWVGVRISITDSSNTLSFGMGEDTTVLPFDKNLLGTAYKLSIKAIVVNEGVLVGEGETFDAATHEYVKYDVTINDELVIDNYIVKSTNAYYAELAGTSIFGSNCNISDIDSFEANLAPDEFSTVLFGQLNQLDPADFGMPADRPANGYIGGVVATNTVFSSNVTFKNGDVFMYPRNGWYGIQLDAREDSLVISDTGLGTGWAPETITKEIAGTAVVGNEINLKVAVELLNQDEEYKDGEPVLNDVRITYYINNVQVYQNEVWATANAETGDLNIGNGLFAVNGNDIIAEMYVGNIFIKNDRAEMPVMLEDTTTIKMDSTYNTDVTLAEGASLNMGNFGTLAIVDGKLVYTDDAGAATTVEGDFVGKAFNLKVAVRAVDIDGDELADDTEIGVYVNNVRIGKTAYSADTYFKYGVNVTPVASEGAVLSKPNQVPTGLRVLTPNHSGWGGEIDLAGVVNNGFTQSKWFKEDMLDIMFDTNVQISEMTSLTLLGLGGGTASVIVQEPAAGSNQAVLQYYTPNGQWFFNGGAAFTIGQKQNFKYTVEKADVDLNGDGVCNDLRFGFFIDGNLVGDTFYYIDAAHSDDINPFYNNQPSAFLQTYGTLKGVFESDYVREELPACDVITMEDIGYFNGTYTPTGAAGDAFGHYITTPGFSFANKIFETDLMVSSGTGAEEFVLGNSGGSGGGIRLSVVDGTATLNCVLYAEPHNMRFALPDFKFDVNQKLRIMIAREGGDYMVGVWIDGKLQNNRFYYGLPEVATWVNYAGFYMNGGNHVWNFDTVEDSVAAAVKGENYTITPSGTVTYTVDDVAVEGELTLSEIGEYVVVATDTQATGVATGTQIVVIYVENDLTEDGKVNVLDFIAMQKNTDGEPLSRVGSFAAGVEYGTACTTKELVAIKKVLLGIA